MIVCLCKNISYGDIEILYNDGFSKRDIKKLTGITKQCGVCKCCFNEKIKELEEESRISSGVEVYDGK